MKTTSLQPKTIFLKDYQVPPFLIENVELEFSLDDASQLSTNDEVAALPGIFPTYVKSKIRMRRNRANTNATNNLVLTGECLKLESVAIDGEILSATQYVVTADLLTIFAVPLEFTLEIKVCINPAENTALSGLYQSNGIFCTQCEAHGFRRITYFLDRPDVMTRFTTTIIANEKLYPLLLSNGNPVESGKLPGGKHWVKWEDPFKKPSYLFALVAGNLEFIEDTFQTRSNQTVTIRIFVEQGNSDKCQHAMQAVKKAMRWDEDKYGREYDLAIYMIVAVSDFNMGAMENKGLNIFNTQYILASGATATDMDHVHVESVIAHEYFHNWTGNRITCRDWFQLSLKEGLTIFRDQSFTEDTTSKSVARILAVDELRTRQFPEDAGPLAHAVRPLSYIEINNFYTSTVYNKGAEVIRMLQLIVGEEKFRAGMDLYFSRHDGDAVTIEDFVQAHEDAAQVDLAQFRQWYNQVGTPILEVQDHHDEITKIYTLKIKQVFPNTPAHVAARPLDIPFAMGLMDYAGEVIAEKLLRVTDIENTYTFANVATRPIPSLLRNFSAPVKIKYNYFDQELLTLFQYDADLFNRWEAGQQYAINLMLHLISDYGQNKPLAIPKEYIAALQHTLRTMQDDKWLLSVLLTLPCEKYLTEQMTFIDTDTAHQVHEFVLYEIAYACKDLLLEIYNKYHDANKPYQFTMDEVGRRSLKNLCLYYLMQLHDADIELLGLQQFQTALRTNMTDTMAALAAFANLDSMMRESVLMNFYQVWHEDALAVNKWFAIQAASRLPNTLKQVKKLLAHPAFDLKNPNKVYALIGTFTNNLACFHHNNGLGYEFLADIVLELNVLNPQIAARMVKPLTAWKRYDINRQNLMRDQLLRIINTQNISQDVYELVTKSLGEA